MSQKEQRENLMSTPSTEESQQEAYNEGAVEPGDWPNPNWWEIYGSETLSRCIGKALQDNPTLQKAGARFDVAKEQAHITRSKLFPLIFFDADTNYEYISKNGLYTALNPKIARSGELTDLSLGFAYEFDFWGKNRNLFQAALGLAKAEEAERADVELMITTAVAQSYFAYLTNLKRLEIVEEIDRLTRKILRLEELLRKYSLNSKLDVDVALENVGEVEKLVWDAKEEAAASRHMLLSLMGEGPDAPLDVEEKLPPFPEKLSLPENLSIDLLARRPDLIAQIWRAQSAAYEVGAARADFYPNINLTALAGLESFKFSNLFEAKSLMASVMPALHLPIFTAGAIRANVKAKKALFDAAIYDYNAALLRSVQEVADLLVIYQAAVKKRKRQDQIVESVEDRSSLTQLRYHSGLDGLFDVYRVDIERAQKELEAVEILYSQYLASIKLIKALGGGYHYEEAAL